MDRQLYPTLNLIDSLRPNHSRLIDAPGADSLERTARKLVAEHWSDNVWLTGRVSAASFTAVVERLERMA